MGRLVLSSCIIHELAKETKRRKKEKEKEKERKKERKKEKRPLENNSVCAGSVIPGPLCT